MNKNYIGTHFGGSLYAMCDPFFMIILSINLGGEYLVVDKGAEIEFVKPGAGVVRAEFTVLPEQIEALKEKLENTKKTVETYHAVVMDEKDNIVARVKKDIYVRKRGRIR